MSGAEALSAGNHKNTGRVSGKKAVPIIVGLLLFLVASLLAGWFYNRTPRGTILASQKLPEGDAIVLRQGRKRVVHITKEGSDGELKWKAALFALQDEPDLFVHEGIVRVRTRDPYGLPDTNAFNLDDGSFRWRLDGPVPSDPDKMTSKEQQNLAQSWATKSWQGPGIVCGDKNICWEIYGGDKTSVISFDWKDGSAKGQKVFDQKLSKVTNESLLLSDGKKTTFSDLD